MARDKSEEFANQIFAVFRTIKQELCESTLRNQPFIAENHKGVVI